MRPIGTQKQFEQRRKRAVKLLKDSHGIRETARMVGASPSSVVRWRDVYKKGGKQALASKLPPSRPCKLSKKQLSKLQRILLKGPKANGYKTDLWTLRRIAQVIRRYFGQSYRPSGVWYIMRRMGRSCQKPERRARETNERDIAGWRKQDWPRIKKARRTGRTIVLADKSGFMLAPTVRRTWAPKGQTPIQYSWDRRDRLSAISAISVSPKRHRLGLYFSMQDSNIRMDDFEVFVSQLLGHFGKGINLVLDRWLIHRWAERRLRKMFYRRIDVEWFPAYAPELNPVEQVWNHSKYSALANYIPEDVFALEKSVCESINHVRSQKSLLRSFFKKAGLKNMSRSISYSKVNKNIQNPVSWDPLACHLVCRRVGCLCLGDFV